MKRSIELANRVLNEQGYLVMSFSDGPMEIPKKGQIISAPVEGYVGEFVPGPFFVLDTATFEEFVRQGELYSSDLDQVVRNAKRAIGFFKLVAE